MSVIELKRELTTESKHGELLDKSSYLKKNSSEVKEMQSIDKVVIYLMKKMY